MRNSEAARDALIGELAQFVTVRLALILLPVREHLLSEGRICMADAVGCAARDVTGNVASILGDYEIERRSTR